MQGNHIHEVGRSLGLPLQPRFTREGTDVQLTGFDNLVGRHCSSSALRSVLAYDGVRLSEAVVFGLGSGLGFFYAVEAGRSPSRRFNGRAPDLEGNFYRLVGQPLKWAQAWQPELLQKALTDDRPLLAQTDIHPIPYYDDAHFIGHGIAVVGLEGDEVIVADIAAQGFSRMPLQALHDAVALSHPPLLAPYHYAPAPEVKGVDVATLAPQALSKTVRYMLEPPTPNEGVAGMHRLADDLPGWADLDDDAWCARFGYQGVEKRGTGGGNFRYLFRDFLQETQAFTDVSNEVIDGFTEAAQLWTAAAGYLKEAAFEERTRAPLNRTAKTVREAARLEGELFAKLRT